jgi:hypothetical protein
MESVQKKHSSAAIGSNRDILIPGVFGRIENNDFEKLCNNTQTLLKKVAGIVKRMSGERKSSAPDRF